MKSSSAKAKGRRCATEVKTIILSLFGSLLDADIVVTSSGETGEDLKFSPAARALLPISVECKNQERLNIWDALEQCEENSGEYTPVVFFRRNRSDLYAAIPAKDLLELYRKAGVQ